MDYTRERIVKLPETIRPQGDSDEEQKVKYEHHRFANSTLKYYIDRCDFLAAYTVAFSLFEDRLRAMAIVKQRDVLGHRNFESFASIDLGRVIAHNYPNSNEDNVFVENLRTAIYNRNKLLHEAMWRINAIQLKDIDDVMELRNIVSSDLNKMKRQVKQSKKVT